MVLLVNFNLSRRIHTRLIKYSKEKPNWKTNSPLILAHPLLSILQKCVVMYQLYQIQAQMIISGLIQDDFAASRLIAFCAISDSGSLDYCRYLLNKIKNANAFSWNIAIRGFCEDEQSKEAIRIYQNMLKSGPRPDNYTYPFVLKACSQINNIHVGIGIVGHVIHLGFDEDLFVHNAMIHMLCACGTLDYARLLFDKSSVRDLISWNSMINGYVKSGRCCDALKLFNEMKTANVKPDEVTMIGIISCCAQLQDLNLGREFHIYVERNGLKFTTPLNNSLMDMYVKCGSLESSQKIFDEMAIRTVISYTTMITGYAKAGLMEVARNLFDQMPEKDVVPWNALIGGYVLCKRSKEALDLFHEMQDTGLKPDQVTMVGLLSACCQLGALDNGLWVHGYIERNNIYLNVTLGTALVDMYAKCGNIQKALQVFHDLSEKNSLTWTAMICGLATHGYGQDAITYFRKMIETGLVPDEVTFLGVLSACCHAGLVHEGRQLFSEMSSRFNIVPKLKHYSCMVDLLGRVGLLDEAEEMVNNMPMKPDVVIWSALFFACRIHGNVVKGERVAAKLLEMDPHDSGNYVLLANMYAEANMQGQAVKVRAVMKGRGIEKTPGCSLIEVNGVVHEFIVRDKSHPNSAKIHECLIHLSKQLDSFECR